MSNPPTPINPSDIIPRASARTSAWSLGTGAFGSDAEQEFVETGAAGRTAGASLRDPESWHPINWRRAQRTVRRLPIRLVQAEQTHKGRKGRVLQRILVRALSGRAVAVRRVSPNRGKQTPGVDNRVWDTPEKTTQAIEELREQRKRPQPLRRGAIPNRSGGQRHLGIPTGHGRTVQALHLLGLDLRAETRAAPTSPGFRPCRSTAAAIRQCFGMLARKTSAHWVLEGDIRACVEGSSHEWLLANIPLDKAQLNAWLTTGYVEEGRWYPTEAGTPQGGLISPAAKKKVKAMLDKGRAEINAHPQARVGEEIGKLTPMIRGGAQDHRHGASGQTFSKVDRQINQALWCWARRRHRHKRAGWGERKYLPRTEAHGQVVSGPVLNRAGKGAPIRLYRAHEAGLKRPIKIKGAANPYDPTWALSCEERRGRQLVEDARGNQRWLKLWLEQKGRCVGCGQPLAMDGDWHFPPLHRRVEGGGDELSNLVFLHANCHRQVHSQGWS